MLYALLCVVLKFFSRYVEWGSKCRNSPLVKWSRINFIDGIPDNSWLSGHKKLGLSWSAHDQTIWLGINVSAS